MESQLVADAPSDPAFAAAFTEDPAAYLGAHAGMQLIDDGEPAVGDLAGFHGFGATSGDKAAETVWLGCADRYHGHALCGRHYRGA
jgi:hypothetical protein